jgi:hypothetical protein
MQLSPGAIIAPAPPLTEIGDQFPSGIPDGLATDTQTVPFGTGTKRTQALGHPDPVAEATGSRGHTGYMLIEMEVPDGPCGLIASVTPWFPRLATMLVLVAVLLDEVIVQPVRALS